MPLYHLTINRIKEEVNGVKSFYFDHESSKLIRYQPGQYLTFIMPTEFGEIRRSYSITSSPTLNEPLSVAVKRIENGIFSRYLVNEARVGEQLLSSGPGGFFTFPDDIETYEQAYFFAAGTGITPVFSLIKTALHAYSNLRLVLIYSNSSPESTLFLRDIRDLAGRYHGRFKVEFLFSNSPDLFTARLHKDFLKILVKKYASASYEKSLFYLCGPENYMVMCTYGLEQLSVKPSHIRREKFTSARVVPKIAPPDQDLHFVTVKLSDCFQKVFHAIS